MSLSSKLSTGVLCNIRGQLPTIFLLSPDDFPAEGRFTRKS